MAIEMLPSVGYAARRWAAIVLPLASADCDIATLAAWAVEVGVAAPTIKVRCSVVGVRAKDSLDFGRALRVLQYCGGRTCNWHSFMSMASSRTLERFLERSGLSKTDAVPAFGDFLERQHLVADGELLLAVRLHLNPACSRVAL
jgi:hypothetical protein